MPLPGPHDCFGVINAAVNKARNEGNKMTRSDDELLPCPCCSDDKPQHMAREICQDMRHPRWNKPQSRIWCAMCGLTMIRDGIDEVQVAWNTRVSLSTPTGSDAVAGPPTITEGQLAAWFFYDCGVAVYACGELSEEILKYFDVRPLPGVELVPPPPSPEPLSRPVEKPKCKLCGLEDGEAAE